MDDQHLYAGPEHNSRISLLATGTLLAAPILLWSGSSFAQASCTFGPSFIADAGCVISGSNETVSTTTGSTPALSALNGGSISFTDSTVTTGGNGSPGAQAQSSGLISLTDTSITTTGGASFGVQALAGGIITLTGGSITTSGLQSNAIVSDGASTVTATGVSISANGGAASGATAQNGGSIVIHGGSISNSNAAGIGSVQAIGAGSRITADQGLQITTSGVGAWAGAPDPSAPTAPRGGVINLDTVTINDIPGSSGVSGVRADGAGSTITATNVSIDLSSDFTDGGGFASSGGQISVLNGTITTSGSVSWGLQASNGANAIPPAISKIDATNVSINTSGESGIGVVASNGALVVLGNVGVSTSGQYAYGLFDEGYLNYSNTPIQTQIDGTNVTIRTTGDTGYGAVLTGSSVLNLTDSSLSATGTNAGGVFVSDPGSVATFLRTPVTSAQLDAAVVQNSGTLNVIDSTWSGGRYGISSRGGSTAAPIP